MSADEERRIARTPAPEIDVEELARGISETLGTAGRSVQFLRRDVDDVSSQFRELSRISRALSQSLQSVAQGIARPFADASAGVVRFGQALAQTSDSLIRFRSAFAVVPVEIQRSLQQFGGASDRVRTLGDVVGSVIDSLIKSRASAEQFGRAFATLFSGLAEMRVRRPGEAEIYGLTAVRATPAELSRVFETLSSDVKQLINESREARTRFVEVGSIASAILTTVESAMRERNISEEVRSKVIESLLTNIANNTGAYVVEAVTSREAVARRFDSALNRAMSPVARGMENFVQGFAYSIPVFGQLLMGMGMMVGMFRGVRDVLNQVVAFASVLHEFPKTLRLVSLITHEKIDKFAQMVRTFLTWLISLEFWSKAFGAIKDVLGGALAPIAGALKGLLSGLAGAGLGGAVGTGLAVAGAVMAVLGVGGAVAEALGITADRIRQEGVKMGRIAQEYTEKGNVLSAGLARASESIHMFVAGAWEWADTLPPVIRQIVKGGLMVVDFFGIVAFGLAKFADFMYDLGRRTGEGIRWLSENISSGARWLGEKISEGASWLGSQVSSVANQAVASLSAGFSQLAGAVASGATSFVSAVSSGVASIGDALSSGARWIAEGLLNLNLQIVNGVAGALSALWNSLTGGANAVGEALSSAGRTLFGWLSSAGESVVSAFAFVGERMLQSANVFAGVVAPALGIDRDRALADAISRLTSVLDRERVVKVEPKVEVKVEVDRGVRYTR